MIKKKKVYVPMAVDILHTGHLNIIEVARNLGDVTIGLLTDEAIVNYKRLPMLEFKERKRIVENIKGVKFIVTQDTYDYEPILRKLKPDYIVHGDDWKTGFQSQMRKKIIKLLNEWGGKLVEPEYTNYLINQNYWDSIKSKINNYDIIHFQNNHQLYVL